MLRRQVFEVFHDGYWYGESQPSPPTWYIITPSLNDTDEIVAWKIRDLQLPVREKDTPGCGIPFTGQRVANSIWITGYTKREIASFLSALNISMTEYDFKSTRVLHPKAGYEKSTLYEHYMPLIRRSVSFRTTVQGWFR